MLGTTNSFSENIFVQPIIIPELEFGNIERQVFAANLMIGADDAALNQAPETFNRVRVDRTDHIFAAGMMRRAMGEVGPKADVGAVFVGREQRNVGADRLVNEPLHGLLADPIKDAGDDLALALRRTNDGGFALAPVAAHLPVVMPVLVVSADIGFVHFDHAHELAEILLCEPSADPVAHVVSGLVTAEPHDAHDLEGADPLLAGQHEVNNAKPVPERLVGVFEDGPGDDREAVAAIRGAGIALPLECHSGDFVDHVGAATGAFDAQRPTVADQIGLTGFLGREGLLPLGNGHLVNAFVGRASHRGNPLGTERNIGQWT